MTFLSLVLGIGAWGLGLLAAVKKSAVWMYSSFSLCLMAAVLPVYDLRNYLYRGDYGGAEDIIGGIIFGELVLICITVLLNTVAMFRIRK